mgnify:FL=1
MFPAIPPAHWNQPDHLDHIYAQVQSLFLPEFTPLQNGAENWAAVKREIRTYSDILTGDSYTGASLKFNSR